MVECKCKPLYLDFDDYAEDQPFAFQNDGECQAHPLGRSEITV